MSGFTCKYHQDRAAVAKCDICGAMLCLECKSVYRHTYHSSNHYSHTVRYELCPECYARKVHQSYNPICFCFFALFLIFFVSIGVGPLFSFGVQGEPGTFIFIVPFLAIPGIMILLLIYQFFVRGPQEKAAADKKLQKALQSLHGTGYSTPSLKFQRNYAPGHRQRYCQKCGQPLDEYATYCGNCGSFNS